jgi:hypothetical protein
MPQPGVDLLALPRRDAEVVVQVLAQVQLRQLRHRHDQQDRLEGDVPLAKGAAHRERPFGVHVGADDRAGPAVVGLDPFRYLRGRDGLPRVTAEIERLREQRRRRIRKKQQRFQCPAPCASTAR